MFYSVTCFQGDNREGRFRPTQKNGQLKSSKSASEFKNGLKFFLTRKIFKAFQTNDFLNCSWQQTSTSGIKADCAREVLKGIFTSVRHKL